jgi:hypothetical protein
MEKDMANLKGDSATAEVPGVSGENTAAGDGVFGKGWRGVVGISDAFQGVFGKSVDNAGVVGESDNLHGVFGVCKNPHGGGVYGSNEVGFGVQGVSKSGRGVTGYSENGDGVFGEGRRGVVGRSETYQGVSGWSRDNAGVVGESEKLHGVFGVCKNPHGGGVYGSNDAGFGVQGVSKSGRGVTGYSETGEGIRGETNSAAVAAIAGFNLNPAGTGAAIYGKKEGDQGHAGFFDGNVHVTRDITLSNADCAEHFDVADMSTAEPGTVMVLGDAGKLVASCTAYDKRVAGVISGAGAYKPGIVLDKQRGTPNRRPVALLGKVYCKVDAEFGAIEVGDLLTSSPTCGHAMKAGDPIKAFGAVIGKALRPLAAGRGLIPILIALQ